MIQATRYLQLPFEFDIERMQQELTQIVEGEWVSHFNARAYETNWSCIPLRSVDGRLDHILSIADANFQDTIILQRCPYFQEVINFFKCEKTSIRLMSLEAGCIIKDHRDSYTSFGDGVTRLHIPILTSPLVTFRIDGETVHFSAGHTWYLNAGCMHGVQNNSAMRRVHLMLDCITNPWLEQVFAEAGFVENEGPRYGDPAINDGNVLEIIEQLASLGNATAARIADRLRTIHSAQSAPINPQC